MFADLKRAPNDVAARIAQIPGVQLVGTRTRSLQPLKFPSTTIRSRPSCCRFRTEDRLSSTGFACAADAMPEAGREQEAVISDGFAMAHKLQPGAMLAATIYGRRRMLQITGIVTSTEFIYQLQPGSIVPDFKSYAILWMNQDPVESAYNMTGAFNHVSVRLNRGAVEKDVIARMDEILRPYGGLGAYDRKDQVSHKYLSKN